MQLLAQSSPSYANQAWPSKLRRVIHTALNRPSNRPSLVYTLAYVFIGQVVTCQSYSWWSLNYDDDDGRRHATLVTCVYKSSIRGVVVPVPGLLKSDIFRQ